MKQFTVELVTRRAGSVCEYCRMPLHVLAHRPQIDHIIARKHRGGDEHENLALACLWCNSSKGSNIAGIDPVDRQLTRLFHPRSDLWHDHFAWEGVRIVGQSPIGRVTVYVLEMNDEQLIYLRRLLAELGEFPPR